MRASIAARLSELDDCRQRARGDAVDTSRSNPGAHGAGDRTRGGFWQGGGSGGHGRCLELAGRGTCRPGDPEIAIADLSHLIDSVPAQALLGRARVDRATARARRDEWALARQGLERAFTIVPNPDFPSWTLRAVTDVATGNRAAYRDTCAALLARMDESTDAATKNSVVSICTLGPGAAALIWRWQHCGFLYRLLKATRETGCSWGLMERSSIGRRSTRRRSSV